MGHKIYKVQIFHNRPIAHPRNQFQSIDTSAQRYELYHISNLNCKNCFIIFILLYIATAHKKSYEIFHFNFFLKGKTCIEPVPTAHCSVTYTTHFVGDTVTYQCHHGYHFKNPHHPATLVCLDQPAFAVWSDFFPVCVRAFRASTSQFSRLKYNLRFYLIVCLFFFFFFFLFFFCCFFFFLSHSKIFHSI